MTSTASRTLPERFETLWPHQRAAIEEVVEAFSLGASVVVLDAPTGSGKTVIAEAVRHQLQTRGLYICTTKSLQDQFARDFPYSTVLKGRENYPTQREDLFDGSGYRLTAADCTKRYVGDTKICDWCDPVSSCPYERAKSRALGADLAVLNTAYYLTECNGPAKFSERPFVVCDEADLLESELMRYCELNISPRRMDTLKLKEPKYVTQKESWGTWVQESIQVVQKAIKRMPEPDRTLFDETDRDFLRKTRQRRALVRLNENLQGLATDLITQETEWIYTGKNGRVSFKPIRVGSLTSQILWRHSIRFLLMSATIVSPSQLLKDDLGYDGSWYSVSVPSTFPKENRPVKYTPCADLSKKQVADYQNQALQNGGNKEKENNPHERLARGINEVIARHPGERVLVHTVSYELANVLERILKTYPSESRRQTYKYGNAAERDKAIREFSSPIQHVDGGHNGNVGTRTSRILLAPSLDRGIDLPDDQCRVIIIAKIPYPYLGDRQVSKRLYSYGGRQWYLIQTIRSIVQMSGRGMRHSSDSCTTYILDAQFNRVWNEGRRYFPDWFKDAMIWTDKLSQNTTPGSLTSPTQGQNSTGIYYKP